ncbi:MAG TPA: hypothetical protein VFJ05_02880, partial [Nitrososphaeraceae archaeon]|nr:hypothetical protein [Nitrososphaeraceae archaeon]
SPAITLTLIVPSSVCATGILCRQKILVSWFYHFVPLRQIDPYWNACNFPPVPKNSLSGIPE